MTVALYRFCTIMFTKTTKKKKSNDYSSLEVITFHFVASEAEVEGLLLVAVVVLLIEEMVLKVDIVLIVLIVEIELIFEIPEDSVPCF